MITSVKISPSYTLVNDKYLLESLKPKSIKQVEFYIIENQITESFTDAEIIALINSTSVKTFEIAVQNMLDNKARVHGYDSILSACTYALVRGRFQQEGVKFAEWRTDVWAYCYEELGKIQQGLRPTPTVAEFLAELPQLTI